MICPTCHTRTKVKDSQNKGTTTYRIHECPKCKEYFATTEQVTEFHETYTKLLDLRNAAYIRRKVNI